ncbi:MAG TPA: hydrolase, partial [Balneola sp.]|nr:hydrolase [Balneola sp.]
VNAAGARVDGMVSIENSRTRPDVNWDNVWYSSVKVHDDYWVAEFAIPFKSINYDTNVEEWGINFVRNDMKRNEYSTWSHVPLGFPGI